ncbi:hypothetical protein HG449_003420 [Candidatus Saccharibacteria bacterium]|nr:hypothetical protein [Candidatus Saccharibacteria bacterium]
MTKKHNILMKILACALFSICTLLLSSNQTFAVERQKTFLQVSPSKQQLGGLEPGEVREGSFKVQNIGTGAFDFKVYASSYEVKGENYDPVFDGSKDGLKIANWFTFSQDTGHLESDTEVTINYTIRVPQNAPGGGQYGAIMVETVKENDDKSNIQAISRVGMVIYSHINGEINRCTRILENKLPSFLFNPPIFGESRVENCGNVDAELSVSLKVYPFFSNEEIYTNEEKPTVLNTLPATKRYHKELWTNSPAIGIFNVEQIIKYGSETKTERKLVVVCPVWLIVLIVLFILSVIFWLVARNRERKNNSRA